MQISSPNTHATKITSTKQCACRNPWITTVRLLPHTALTQPSLGGKCVCREEGGVRNGNAWSSGMLAQILHHLIFHTEIISDFNQVAQAKPKVKASVLPGFSAQT